MSKYILYIKALLLLGLAAMLASCAGLPLGYEQPVVNVTSVKSNPGGEFEIQLRIVNPNNFRLSLDGVAWTLDVEGRRLLTGVGNDLPVIEAYGDGTVVLSATPSLFNTLRVVMDLARGGAAEVDYDLNVKLDPAGIYPAINIRDEGRISLNEALENLPMQ